MTSLAVSHGYPTGRKTLDKPRVKFPISCEIGYKIDHQKIPSAKYGSLAIADRINWLCCGEPFWIEFRLPPSVLSPS